MFIDSHQHFWNYLQNKDHYTWMGDSQSVLKRNYGPPELIPEMEKNGVLGTVAIQAREMNMETDYLLDLAERYDFILGVVGWLDLCKEGIEEDIERYAANTNLKGLRMVIHDHPNTDFAASDNHMRGVSLLKKYDLSYDLLLKPEHIQAAIKLVASNPDQKFVIDHIAKPSIKTSEMQPWLQDITRIARYENVSCKISGMVTEANWRTWKYEEFVPYMDAVFEQFGKERIMVGSDWPVCQCSASYTDTIDIVRVWAKQFSESEQTAIFNKNCSRFYQLVN